MRSQFKLSQETVHLLKEAKDITLTGLHQAFGDNISIKAFALPIFLYSINRDILHSAAYGPLTALLSFVNLIAYSCLFQLPSRTAALCSIEKEKARPELVALLQISLLYAIVISIPCVFPFIYSEWILENVMGLQKEIAQIGQSFLRPYALAFLPSAISVMASEFIVGTGKTAIFMAGSVLLAAYLTLSYFFALDSKKTFDENVYMLVIFNLAESCASALLYSLYISLNPAFNWLELRNFFRILSINSNDLLKFLKNALALTLRIGFDVADPLIISALCGQLATYSIQSQAAFTLATQPQTLNNFINIFFSLAAGNSVSYAKNNPDISPALFKKIVYLGIAITVIPSLIIPILFVAMPRLPGIIFQNTDDIVLQKLENISIPIALFSWLSAFYFCLMFQSQSGWNDFYRGVGAGFVGVSIGSATSAGLGLGTSMGATGLAIGLPIGMLASILIMLYGHKHGVQKIVEEKTTKKHGLFFSNQAREEEAQELPAIVSSI